MYIYLPHLEIKECASLLNELRSRSQDATFANFLRASNAVCQNKGTQVCCPTGQGITNTTPAPSQIVPKNTDEIPRRLLNVEEGCGSTVGYFKKIVGGEVSRKGRGPGSHSSDMMIPPDRRSSAEEP